MALTIARFPFVRTLKGFEIEVPLSIDPRKIRDLATCRWVAYADTVVLQGSAGVVKTHLKVALWAVR
jgi:DNA replication protein DnaC